MLLSAIGSDILKFVTPSHEHFPNHQVYNCFVSQFAIVNLTIPCSDQWATQVNRNIHNGRSGKDMS
jgi:hypothetical protein